MVQGSQAVPGVEVSRTITPRDISKRVTDVAFGVQIKGWIDGSSANDGSHTGYEKYLRGGCIMAYDPITAKKWVPAKITKLTAAASADTTLTVADSSAFVVGDSVVLNNDIAGAVTITAIASSTSITVDGALTGAVGSCLEQPAWCIPLAILLDDEVSLWDRDKATNVDKQANLLICGYVDQSYLLHDVEACFERYDGNLHRNFLLTDLDDRTNASATAFMRADTLEFAQYVQADLAADADVSAGTVVWAAPCDCIVVAIELVAHAAAAGIDGSNTSAFVFKRNNTGSNVATVTFNAVTLFPGQYESYQLGSPPYGFAQNAHFGRGDCLTMAITNGTTADLPEFTINIVYKKLSAGY